MDELVFTPSAVLGLLAEIPELEGQLLSAQEDENGVTITIGEATYQIESNPSSEVEVDSEALEEIADINEEGYEDLDIVDEEPIEGGIVKELAKTLMLGGLIRLTGSALKNM